MHHSQVEMDHLANVEDDNSAKYQVELDYLEVVAIALAAERMGTTVQALLKSGAANERLLYVAIAPSEATLRAIPSHHSPLHAIRSPGGTIFVALDARYCVELGVRGTAQIKHWPASITDSGALAWHRWHLDKSETVQLDMVFVAEWEVGARNSGGPSAAHKAPLTHRVKSRSAAPLTAEIKFAKTGAVDPEDATSVWAELVKLAEAKFGCLLGADEDTIKYQDGEAVLNFKKRSLRERMQRERYKK